MNPTLMTRLQTLADNAQAVPKHESRLDALTRQLAEVAEERAACLQLLEECRADALRLQDAEIYLEALQSRVYHLGPNNSPDGQPGPAPLSEVAPEPDSAPEPTPDLPLEQAPGADPVPEAAPEPDLSVSAAPDALPEAAAPEEPPFPTLAERVMGLMSDGTPRTAREVTDTLDIPASSVASRLSKLVSAGELVASEESPKAYRLSGSSAPPELVAMEQTAPVVAVPPATSVPVTSPASRDLSDVRAIRTAREQVPTASPPPVKPSKPVTERDEEAVLLALMQRPNHRGSPSILSGKAGMGTTRVLEVLEHLERAGRVIRPEAGDHLWSLA